MIILWPEDQRCSICITFLHVSGVVCRTLIFSSNFSQSLKDIWTNLFTSQDMTGTYKNYLRLWSWRKILVKNFIIGVKGQYCKNTHFIYEHYAKNMYLFQNILRHMYVNLDCFARYHSSKYGSVCTPVIYRATLDLTQIFLGP